MSYKRQRSLDFRASGLRCFELLFPYTKRGRIKMKRSLRLLSNRSLHGGVFHNVLRLVLDVGLRVGI